MCDCLSPASWMISSARSVSIASIPRACRPSLRSISSVASDLTLITSRAPLASAMPATIAVASAPSRAQCTVPPARVTAASRRSSCSGSVAIARALIAAPASRSSSQSGSSATSAAAWRGSSASPCRGCGAAGRPAASRGPPRESPSSVAARISARCIARTPARWRRSAPPMCIRQELSAAVQTSARVSRMRRSLSESIAIDVSAFLTANVPPKPQHSCGSSRSTRSMPLHGLEQPPRPVADVQHPQRVAGRVQRDAVRERRADVVHAEPVDRANSVSSNTRSATAGQGRGPCRRTTPTARRPPRGVEHALEAPRERQPVVGVARVEVHLPAAGLLLGEVDLAAEALQQLDDRPARLREQRVVEAGDEQRDPHRGGAYSALHADVPRAVG